MYGLVLGTLKPLVGGGGPLPKPTKLSKSPRLSRVGGRIGIRFAEYGRGLIGRAEGAAGDTEVPTAALGVACGRCGSDEDS
jgi:hypothetical protein